MIRVRCLLLASLLSTTLTTAHALPAPSVAESAAMDLLEFQIDGNTVLPAVAVERAVYRFLGPGKSFGDLEKARAALEAAYQDEGYLSVTVVIPEQRIVEGLVRLQVIEGSVEKLKVSGNRFTARSEIRAQTPALAPGEVPHFPTVQQELAALGRTPDRRATPLLRPGKLPGKLEVELAVEDALPLHGSIELNNRQSPDTSHRRIEAGLRYDNLFQKGHSLGFNYVVSPLKTDEVSVLMANYLLPLGRGRSLSLQLQRSNSNIASAAETSVVGKGTTFSGRLNLQLPPGSLPSSFFHSLALGFDRKDLEETQNIVGADQKSAPLLYSPLVAQYTAGSFDADGDIVGNLALVAGGLGPRSPEVDCQGVQLDQFACRRAGARPSFAALRGDIAYSRRLLGWEGLLRVDFQDGTQPLVSSEQFVAGGIDSVRGYLEGEAAGDFGWRLRAEIKTPSVLDNDRTSLRGVAFVENASLGLNDPLPGQTAEFKLASVGLGLRLKVGKEMHMSVDWARAGNPGPRTTRGEQRAHMRLGYQF